MHALEPHTIQLIRSLQNTGIDPILYGSQGVSLFLGQFKKFGDIDLLVDEHWLREDWKKLQSIMQDLSYRLTDAHEHEFTNKDGLIAAFASKTIIIRDNIAPTIDDASTQLDVGGILIQTLTPECFVKAYQYSAKDGYRRDTRGKKDSEVILLLEQYLHTNM